MQIPTWSGSRLPARTRGDASAKGKRLNPIVVVAAPGRGGAWGGFSLMKQKPRPKGRPKPCHHYPFNIIKQPV